MFKHNGYRIDFEHVQMERSVIRKANATKVFHSPFAEKTFCLIREVGSDPKSTPIAVGIAMCSLKDPFDKAKGRDLAFARAMHKMVVGKDERFQWWRAFWISADGRHTDGAVVAFINGIISLEDWGEHL